jgi:uncharacterized protein (TIGR02996 family)
MVNNPEPFLQAICEHPDDDTHRLIFADWLEDRGDNASRDRAEFIRLQMELCDPTIAEGNRAVLQSRGQQLLARYEQEWVRTDLRGLVAGGRFRRGFVEEVTLTAAAFVKQASRLLDLAPIRTVHLRAAANHVKPLSQLPGLQRLSGLGLRNNLLQDSHLHHLVASPYLNRLTWLDLGNNEIRWEAMGNLRIPNLPLLHTLNLALNCVHPTCFYSLNKLPALRCLDLDRNYLGIATIEILCHGAPLPYESLGLGGNWLTAHAARCLANWDNSRSLRTLRLDWNPLGDEGIQELVHSPYFDNLQELDLSHTDAGEVGLRAIHDSPLSKQLRRLTLLGLPRSGRTTPGIGRRWDGVVID